jgi:hypothetical protein
MLNRKVIFQGEHPIDPGRKHFVKLRSLLFLAVLFSVCLHPLKGFPADLTGREIMERQQDRHALETETSTIVMLLLDDKGNQTTRIMRRWSKRFPDGLYRNLCVFLEPRDIAGTALLTWQLEEGKSKQWLYLPGQETLRRIASQGRKSYFMGTDFTYEDLQPDTLENYQYEVKGSETLDGDPCTIIEITPGSKEIERESAYSKRLTWIRKDLLYPVKVEFYDRRGKCIKTQTNHELIPLEGEAWTAKKALMINHRTDHKTIMGLKTCETGHTIDDSIFTERHILSGKHLD